MFDEEWYEETEDWDAYESDSCYRCGPHCEHWGGDGLCMLEIERQAQESEEYQREFVTENVHCPVCGEQLTEFKIPATELWLWPGDFYNPMIALDIYGILGAPKGVLHHHENVYHIWVGLGQYGKEKLIRLTDKEELHDRQNSTLAHR